MSFKTPLLLAQKQNKSVIARRSITLQDSKEVYIWATTWDFQQCGMCDKQRLIPACAYAQSDQSLCCSLENFKPSKYIAWTAFLKGGLKNDSPFCKLWFTLIYHFKSYWSETKSVAKSKSQKGDTCNSVNILSWPPNSNMLHYHSVNLDEINASLHTCKLLIRNQECDAAYDDIGDTDEADWDISLWVCLASKWHKSKNKTAWTSFTHLPFSKHPRLWGLKMKTILTWGVRPSIIRFLSCLTGDRAQGDYSKQYSIYMTFSSPNMFDMVIWGIYIRCQVSRLVLH